MLQLRVCNFGHASMRSLLTCDIPGSNNTFRFQLSGQCYNATTTEGPTYVFVVACT